MIPDGGAVISGVTGGAACDRLSGKGMRQEIAAAVKRIREDRDHGARQLALEALRALADVAPSASGEELREWARALVLARPMMAAIENAVALAWERYEDAGDPATGVAQAIERLEAAPDGMAATARGVLPGDTLITLTYSSAVIDVLDRLRPRRVIVSESRPLYEGLRTARALAGHLGRARAEHQGPGVAWRKVLILHVALGLPDAGVPAVDARIGADGNAHSHGGEAHGLRTSDLEFRRIER